jgi:hypothetical protein
MNDYLREIDFINRISTAASKLNALQSVVRPVFGIAAMLGLVGEGPLTGLDTVRSTSEGSLHLALAAWGTRYGEQAGTAQRSAHIRMIALHFPVIGELRAYGGSFVFHDVGGIPVAPEPHGWSESFYSPAGADSIFAALRKQGSRWRVTSTDLEIDNAMMSPVLAAQTREIIDRTRPHTTCRAWVLWGPPRGGKSIAARQIAHELVGGWVRICGDACRSSEAWDTAKALGARAIILDDLDCNAGHESALLDLIERARTHCRVIVSTVNILPNSDGAQASAEDRKRHELRGAILAPGRAADEAPREYATLDRYVRDLLAPTVPEELRHPELLAAYLVELERRKQAHGVVTQADVNEMLARMRAVGER